MEAIKRFIFALIVLLLFISPASAAKLVDVRLDQGSWDDTMGNLTAPTFYRESAATHINSSGVLTTTVGNRTNLWIVSEPVNTTGFIQANISVSAYSWPNTITSGYAVVFSDSTGLDYFRRSISVTAGTTYILSFYIIMNDGSLPVDGGASTSVGDFCLLLEGELRTQVPTITLIGSGVYRVSSSWTALATGASQWGINKYSNQSTKGFKVSGFQLEALPSGTTIGPDLMDQETLGAELVANGTFAAWTGDNPDSWTVTGESGSDPMVTQVSGKARMYSSAGASITMSQTILTVDKIYKVVLDVIANTGAGGILISVGADTSQINIPNGTTGTSLTYYMKANGVNLTIKRGAAMDATIDNVSVREVTTPAKGSFHGTAMLAGSTELVTNGGFETAGAGTPDLWGTWVETVAGSDTMADSATAYLGSHAATLTYVDNGATYISNTIVTTAGKLYKLEFYTRGDATVGGRYQVINLSADPDTDIVPLTATGITAATYAKVTKYFVAPTGCTSVEIRLQAPSAAGVAYFDYVSVRQVQTAWTREGTNTVEIDESDGSGGAFKVTYVDSGNGALTYLRDTYDQNADLVVGRWYQVTLKSKVAAGNSVNIYIRNGAGTLLTAGPTITGTTLASYTFYHKATETQTNYLVFSGLGAGESIWIDDLTIKQVPDLIFLSPGPYTATSGSTAVIPTVPRFDYAGGTGGLLLEGEGVNLCAYSTPATMYGAGFYNRVTGTISQADPAGGTDAILLTETTATGQHHVNTGTTSGTGYIPTTVTVSTVTTASAYFKKGTVSRDWVYIEFFGLSSTYQKRAWFNLSTGAVGTVDASATSGIQPIGNGWYRCWISTSTGTGTGGPYMMVGSASGDNTYSFAGDTQYSFYVFGFQWEATAFPTSYIPTAGVPRIRTTSAGNATGPVGMRWTMSTALKNALGATSPSVGTLLLEWKPGYVTSTLPDASNFPMVSVQDSALSVLYNRRSGTAYTYKAYDGTNNPTTAIYDAPIGTAMILSSRWDSTVVAPTTGAAQVSEKHAGTWTHGTATNYDGTFSLGTYLWLNYANEAPSKFGRLRIYNYWVRDTTLDDPPSSNQNVILGSGPVWTISGGGSLWTVQ